ncbi:Rhamnogalacturonyl hydrolase YesR [Granulicella rosea]|uniref:Rhamnogalacturonyl hydrolase YesR n=1 Tax=Granulicella rosea TaxID=474952 RepID=A0A239MFV5_9BACT|nr:glycoside hydrolase family 88 protein [Granulicella rosea]SNT41917.1 Rhamnogalacturonyl hydrolase YesR [Granulicella rosea]
MPLTRRTFLESLCLATLAPCAGFAQQQKPVDKEFLPEAGDSPDDAGPLAADLSARLDPRDIRKAMLRVGDWQLKRVRAAFNDDWTFAALYTGVMAAARTLPSPAFEQDMLAMGRQLHWQPGPDPLHADHQAVGQTYLELYLQHRDPAMLAPIQQRFGAMMLHPDDPKKPLWWWCDALFMAPPVCTRLYKATGNTAYLNFLDREWNITSTALYDTEEHLFYRDQRYLAQREKNGRKLFWSRGNGWVLAGLARVLEYLPQDWPTRPRYVAQLQQMSAALAKLQGPDGLWRSGLLDPSAYALPEVSGSGFIAYGIAWGIRHGLLDEKTYLPVVQKAWQGMIAHIYRDGRLGCIQPVGAAPGQFKPTSSYVYGVGAFLLAGSELLQRTNTLKAE